MEICFSICKDIIPTVASRSVLVSAGPNLAHRKCKGSFKDIVIKLPGQNIFKWWTLQYISFKSIELIIVPVTIAKCNKKKYYFKSGKSGDRSKFWFSKLAGKQLGLNPQSRSRSRSRKQIYVHPIDPDLKHWLPWWSCENGRTTENQIWDAFSRSSATKIVGSVVEPDPEPEPPESYHFATIRTGTGTVFFL
jgi:hypothetical protein